MKFRNVFAAGILVLLAVCCILAAGCTTTEQAPAAVTPTPEPVVTGSLQVTGQPGYIVYLDGIRIGKLNESCETFTGITPGPHEVTVSQYGVSGTTQVTVEPEQTAKISIGLSKNQILMRMEKVLYPNKKYWY